MIGLGANVFEIGFAIMIATLTEMPVFFFGNRLLKRFPSQNLFLFSLLMMGIRSILYALVKTTSAVFIVQAFGGMVFPVMWLAGVAYADQHAPAGMKSTAQGLFGA